MKKILKIILIVFNSILLLLFVGSTLAGWIAPSRSIVFSYLSYGYLYLLFANVAFIILWLCLKSKWFLMSTVAIVLRFAFLPLYFQIGGSETLPNGIDESECIKLLTFNAHRFQGNERQEPMTDTNMKLFLEVVDEEQPDILTMQEYIGRGDTLHLTDQLTRRGYVYQVSGYNNGSMTGTVIFSKLPLFNEVHLDGVKCYADMLWRGDTVRLFSLHLDSYRLDESDHQEIHKLSHGTVDNTTGRSTLYKFRETILAHEQEWHQLEPLVNTGRRILLAGDFNDTPASYIYQKLSRHLKDGYREAGQGFSTTYHGSFASLRNNMSLAFRIDFVMHTPDITTCTYKRIKLEISDHYPVLVTVRKQS